MRPIEHRNVESEEASHEPIPFDFEYFDAVCNSNRNDTLKHTSFPLDKHDKKLLYSLLRVSNATLYAGKVLDTKLIDTTECNNDNRKSHREYICERITERLALYPLDTRIIVLQRALAAWHNDSQKIWNKLIKVALRACFMNDETLKVSHIVKILASLSKWRFKGIAEIIQKLDIAIMAEDGWDIESASQILWSLAHLKAYDVKAFDYMNNVILSSMVKPDFDITNLPDETLHRILNPNIIRMSHTGKGHECLLEIMKALESNANGIDFCSPKTMMAISAILPMYPSPNIVERIAHRMSCILDKFTHSQAAHLFYNLAIIAHTIPTDVFDHIVSSLFEYKEMVYHTEVAYIPSLVAKLMYTYKVFLGNYDHCFVSKCMADLNANLHLLEPFSLVGNIHCIEMYKMAEPKISEQQETNIKQTMDNMLKMNDGDFVKVSFGTNDLIPLNNIKLWHRAAIYKLTSEGMEPMCNALGKFNELLRGEGILRTLKDFALFLTYVASSREFTENRGFKTAVIVAAMQLWNLTTESKREMLYWNSIIYYMNVMGIMKAFITEVGDFHTKYNSKYVPVTIMDVLQKCHDKGPNIDPLYTLLEWLKQRTSHSTPYIAENIIARYALLISLLNDYGWSHHLKECATIPIEDWLLHNFYSYTTEIVFVTDHNTVPQELLEYLNVVLKTPINPIKQIEAYTTLFFSQDSPNLLTAAVPLVAIADVFGNTECKVDISQVAQWLSKAKRINNLSAYLETIGHKKQDAIDMVELDSYLKNDTFKVQCIKNLFYVGPYLCHYGIFGSMNNEAIFVFINGQYRNAQEHTLDVQRRNTLKQMDVHFIELAVIDTNYTK
uniref:RAP domain-containing protein n=2 Tax=Babesia bovis TaxID=5865 RepID=A7ATP6_BABBO|eukprot:XP_001609875.1 hypothetical protein [Babesia bovis T2Bo]